MSHEYFEGPGAAEYDQRFAKLQPTKDALHLLLPAVLAPLSDEARILVVGGGTGDELLALASVHPGWRFTVVEPAASMLAVCRAKAAQLEQVTFHNGYLDTLPPTAPFDAATSILVSHFITDRSARVAYFRAIRERLAPGAPLATLDLCGEDFEALLPVWLELLRQAGIPDEGLKRQREAFGDKVAVTDTSGLLAIAREAGFTSPTPFFQALLMRGWFARA